MEEARTPHPKRLLKVERIKAAILSVDPTYGDDLPDGEWERITERLEALARLLWDYSRKQADREQRPD